MCQMERRSRDVVQDFSPANMADLKVCTTFYDVIPGKYPAIFSRNTARSL